MTDRATVTPVSEAARRLASRWESGINPLARRISRESFGDLPGYGDLPDDMVDVEIAETVRQGLRLFAQVARGEARSADDAYELFRQRAARRAREGFPLTALVHAHLAARQEMWRVLRDLAEPGEERALLELADLLLRALPGDLSDVVAAYVREQNAHATDDREHRRSLARELARGSALPREELDALGFPHGAVVVAVRLPATRSSTGRPSAVARRRLERQWQQRLDHRFGPDALVVLDADLGYLVFPRLGREHERLPEESVQLLAGSRGEALPAATADAEDLEGLADAFTRAREILALASALGRGPGPHRMQDVLLEYHLSHPGHSGAAALGKLLEPVLAHPELAATLRGYVAHQQDRRATAEALGLHPNTVDNRIRRAGELLGADLTTPHGYALVLAALAARGLIGTGTGTD